MVVVADLGAGGVQRVVTTLVDAFSRRGTRICVVTLSGASSDHFQLPATVTRHALGLQSPASGLIGAISANLGRIRAIRHIVRATAAPTVLALAGITNILTVIACAGLPARVVISERNDPARQRLGRPWDWLRRRLYARADMVTANSRTALTELASYVPAARLALVPNPVVPPAAQSPRGDGAPHFLSVGRLARQKAYDVVLAAVAQLAPSESPWRLRVVGEGGERDALQAQAHRLGLSGRIDWLAPVRDVWPLYQQADAFVLASRHEGTPNALLEAMACGVPVIVSDACGGALDYVEDGKTGLVVPVEDAAALAGAMQRLITDPALRRRLGDAGRARVTSEAAGEAVRIWERVLGLQGKNAA